MAHQEKHTYVAVPQGHRVASVIKAVRNAAWLSSDCSIAAASISVLSKGFPREEEKEVNRQTEGGEGLG